MVTILVVLFVILCPLIVFLVLVQDPKGGGLAGVLGGAGGSSAFGAKTADVVMKTTVALGIVFFLLAVGLGIKLKHPTTERTSLTPDNPPIEAPAVPGGGEAGEVDSAATEESAGESAESAPAEESAAAVEDAAAPAEGAAMETPSAEAVAAPAAPAEDAAAPTETEQ